MNITEEQAIDIVRTVFRSNDLPLKDAFNDFITHTLLMNPNATVTPESIRRAQKKARAAAIKQ